MWMIAVLTSVGLAVGAGLLALISQPDTGLDDLERESANWRQVDAEVLSVLRAGNRTFLLVRFPVGTSLIRNDVRYPLPGPVPYAGQRVPIKYDPVAPARVVFDLHPETRRTPNPAGQSH
ncbi:hypothetical protein E0H75_38500 [Kribbella capetownensis]|uniref:DUF3592 domain-containing protein n=2 Tax=Kribbella capetownensis TaxID=1572659 RepID=A0A4R0J8A1_9ACTN|nr:hypothetical protein E0H75_38500 [Kribbella capetownensis]